MARILNFKTMDVLVSASERDLFQAGEKGLTKAEICRLAQNKLVNGPKLSGGEKARFFNLVLERAKAKKVAGRFYHGNFSLKPQGGKEMVEVVTSGKASEAERKAAEAVRQKLIAAGTLTREQMIEIAAQSMGISPSEFPGVRWWTLAALVSCKKVGNRYKFASVEERLANAAKARAKSAKKEKAARREEKKVAKAAIAEGTLLPGGAGPVHVFEAPPDIRVAVEQGATVLKGLASKVVVHLTQK